MQLSRIVALHIALIAILLSSDRAAGQFDLLTLSVDRDIGETQIINQSPSSITFDAYFIESQIGSLDPFGWLSLSLQEPGWDELNPDPFSLAEANLLADTTIDPGGAISLGTAYDVFVDGQDLEFTYSEIGSGSLLQGFVEYVGFGGGGGLVADFNADGIVSHADYSVLGDFYGQPDFVLNGGGNFSGTVDQGDYDLYVDNYRCL